MSSVMGGLTPKIAPHEIRYIKLGQEGRWAPISLAQGELHFGYRTIPHELCLKGEWEAVAQILVKEGRSIGKAHDGVREIRDFYALGWDCLWITFVDGHLHWAIADTEVTWHGPEEEGRGARSRKTVDGWHNANVAGEPLRIDRLSTRLTQLAAYRQTICKVKAGDYLLRRINAIEEPVVARAREARSTMTSIASDMIAGLHWADFETLVDLMFARMGWQRVSRVGENITDVDIVLQQPATGEVAFVQVKSKANQAVLDDYLGRFERSGLYDRFFFVCHTLQKSVLPRETDRVHVWTGDRLADAAVNAGLFDWLLERSM